MTPRAQSAPRLLVISPMRNEAGHVDRLVAGMRCQKRPPDLWLLADDGSRDGTVAAARRETSALPFAQVVEVADRTRGLMDIDARLEVAAEAQAFNAALEDVDLEQFDFIAKVDADIELPTDWFARIEAALNEDPRLGIVGSALTEPARGGWRLLRSPDYHVHGAVKVYRRACFHEIGGLAPMLGWDTIDETYARMRGWTTRTVPDLVARHHRPCGDAGSRLRGRARYGRCAYIVRYGLGWVALRSIKVALRPPVVVSGAAFLWGYLEAALRRAPRVDDPEFAGFVRRELKARVSKQARAVAAAALSRPTG